jgi:homocysteine S-methyltransferase
VLVDLVGELGASAWLSYQCRDGATTAAGEPIAEAVALASDAPGVFAVGINCTAPRHVPALLAAAGRATTKPLVAYPNDGDTWDAQDRRWIAADARGRFDPAAVASWAGLGAAWLGGCCGTGPADIAALAAALTSS